MYKLNAEFAKFPAVLSLQCNCLNVFFERVETLGIGNIYIIDFTNTAGNSCELVYNAIGAVAKCPYKWGVGSAFHRMKIHIYFGGLGSNLGV